jgi:hypothetical protein
VPAGGGDTLAGRNDARTGDLAAVDGITQRDGGTIAVAQVAHRGEAG